MPDVRPAAPLAAAVAKALAGTAAYDRDRAIVAPPGKLGDRPIDSFILLPDRSSRLSPAGAGQRAAA
jgi:hypothetical protein